MSHKRNEALRHVQHSILNFFLSKSSIYFCSTGPNAKAVTTVVTPTGPRTKSDKINMVASVAYFTTLLELDALFLNQDRHLNNIALLHMGFLL